MQARKKLATAAFAAVAAMGVVHAYGEERGSSLFTTEPQYLDAQPQRKPLMSLLDQIGVGQAMSDARLELFGHVEASWTISDSSPPDNIITGRVFDIENEDPTLNQFDITLDRQVLMDGEQFDVGGRIELMWGGDARFIHSNGIMDNQGFAFDATEDGDVGDDEQFDLTQFYVDFGLPVGSGARVRVGKFVTPAGYETINPTGNALYSHSFMFGYAIPFTHTGVLGTMKLTDEIAVEAGLVRGWDQSFEDTNDWWSLLGRVAWEGEMNDRKTGAFLTVITGPETNNSDWRTLFDGIVTYAFADNLTFAVNGDFAYDAANNAAWGGLAGYASLVLTDNFTLNTRVEWFNDDDGVRISSIGSDYYEATVGLAIKPFPQDRTGQYLVIRPEVRYDYSEKGTFDANTDHDQATFGIDAYFAF